MKKNKKNPAHQIASDLTDVLIDPIESLTENLKRVRHVLAIYQKLYGHGSGRRSADKSDLLRFAVVFLHATVEEFLRSIAAYYLPLGNEEALNRVSLVGLSNSGRAEKFLLGKLARHRGKSVDTLLDESVNEYLTRLSFNNTTDVMTILQDCGLETFPELDQTLPKIQQIMERRHRIVHQTDREKKKDKVRKRPSSLSASQIKEWVNDVSVFAKHVIKAIIEQELKGHEEQLKELARLKGITEPEQS